MDLRRTHTIRERAGELLALARQGRSEHFTVHDEALDEAAACVAEVTRQRYPDLRIPYHSRWRHFEAGGVDRRAWMDEALTRRRIKSGIQTPVAYLNCNFPAPVGDKPATFSHDDVITLFHETGHGLHHMLTQVEDLVVSGIHGV